MSEKARGLLVNLALYAAAFGTGLVPFILINDIFIAEAVFTAAATLVIYIVTCFVPDTSLYDPYWSVAPPVMLLCAMIKYGLWSPNAVLIFIFFVIWSARLTSNWAFTYRGLLHEDWRYRMYREKCSPFAFALINLVGLQFVPTIVVYFGLVGALFVIQSPGFTPLIIIGLSVMLFGTALEFVSDRSIHRFLAESGDRHITCRVSVWKYSRHPNYLGEMSFWFGVFLCHAAVRPDIWYLGLGFLLIELLFLMVSIPMMERHNSERRSDYEDYRAVTSVLLLLPVKNKEGQVTESDGQD